ncbi:hypothetical protein B4099_0369 [Heyndrickxia coagulans]|uniref:Uncharacterized protein n=1 Tax=Heyndrickxia coagulans TaxID=1398 RepID=A0A150K6S0_HEYCO|nr:hypothetical protein B4099_0369 [Heyndrickxia coagulans]
MPIEVQLFCVSAQGAYTASKSSRRGPGASQKVIYKKFKNQKR